MTIDKFGLVLLFVVTSLFLFSTEIYATVFVSPVGDNSDGHSWDTAFTTINTALVYANTGEAIWVRRGSYVEGLKINRPVRLIGGFVGTETSESTLDFGEMAYRSEILGGSPYAMVIIVSTVARLEGFSIRRGTPQEAQGCLIESSSAILRYCDVEANVTDESGAGVAIGQSQVHLDHCVIQNNSALGGGGGISSSNSTLTITNCIIRDNEARDVDLPPPLGYHIESSAAGIVFSGTLTIDNSVIANNRATKFSQIDGGGPGLLLFKNCTIYSEDTEFMRVDPEGGDPGIFNNCILWGNSQVFPSAYPIDVSYSNSSQSIDGPGNFSEDPLFVDPDNGDFHLMPDSPCIDSGTDVGVYSDIEGVTRPIDIPNVGRDGTGDEFDMGAFEFVPSPTPEPTLVNPRSDIDQSGKVDALDLMLLLADWKKVSSP